MVAAGDPPADDPAAEVYVRGSWIRSNGRRICSPTPIITPVRGDRALFVPVHSHTIDPGSAILLMRAGGSSDSADSSPVAADSEHSSPLDIES